MAEHSNDPWVLETAVGYKIELLESHQTYILSMHASEEERNIIYQKVLSPTKKHAMHKLKAFEPNGHKPSQFIIPIITAPKRGVDKGQ